MVPPNRYLFAIFRHAGAPLVRARVRENARYRVTDALTLIVAAQERKRETGFGRDGDELVSISTSDEFERGDDTIRDRQVHRDQKEERFVRGREQGQKDFYTAAFLYVREYARRETHQTRAAALFRSRDFIRAIDSKVELRLPHFLLLPFPFALTPFFHLLLLLLPPATVSP